MCAGVAAGRGKRVVVIEHADRPGKKILISGGGRCNFTNVDVRPECYLSENPHFAKSALARFRPQAFLDLVNSYNIAWHEKTLGQLFCDGSAKQIVDMLLAECAKGDVDLRLGASIQEIRHGDGQFHVATGDGAVTAPALVVATGGPSIPKMGATGFAYEVARQFGIGVVAPRPALVPLTLGAADNDLKALSGVAFPSEVALGTHRFREATLCTHKGLSGPAILQISSYWQPGQSISINLLPGQDADCLVAIKQARPKASVATAISELLPNRLAAVVAERLGVANDILIQQSDQSLRTLASRLQSWSCIPTGREGFAKAEVTAGGVATSDLSSKTMCAKDVPGLYFIGEAVDVTGWLGGYNFQWAWASGVVAGEAIAA